LLLFDGLPGTELLHCGTAFDFVCRLAAVFQLKAALDAGRAAAAERLKQLSVMSSTAMQVGCTRLELHELEALSMLKSA
jgi:hypothetical protein